MSFYVLGNWKSNGSPAMLREFEAGFAGAARDLPAPVNTGLALPFHLVDGASDWQGALIGAQNVSAFGEGAYTGEITAGMLRELGCHFCLVGHSERRQYFKETVEETAAKLAKLLEAGVLPVLCIGETLEQRESGQLEAVLSYQLGPVHGLAGDAPLVVAYEPVWAIGTGVAAEPSDVADAHALVKRLLDEAGHGGTAALYGGSVKPKNAESLGRIEGVDGFLVGGASLKAADFAPILQGFLTAKGFA